MESRVIAKIWIWFAVISFLGVSASYAFAQDSYHFYLILFFILPNIGFLVWYARQADAEREDLRLLQDFERERRRIERTKE